jgi:hypothetical protein
MAPTNTADCGEAKGSPSLAMRDERRRAVIEDSRDAGSSKSNPGGRGVAMREEAVRCVRQGWMSAPLPQSLHCHAGTFIFPDVGVSPLAVTAGSSAWMGGCLTARGQAAADRETPEAHPFGRSEDAP